MINPDNIIMNTKIAVATKDGNNLAAYFGGSKIFKIFEIRGGKIINKQVRKIDEKINGYGNAAMANRQKKTVIQHELINALGDCEVIITRRMSKNTWNELGHIGKEIIFTSEANAEKNVKIFLQEKMLDTNKMHY